LLNPDGRLLALRPVSYAEIAASLSSKSVGPGTQANLDEFTDTTSNAIPDYPGISAAETVRRGWGAVFAATAAKRTAITVVQSAA